MAALGYDAAYVLVEAMERTKVLTPAELRDQIAVTKGFKGVTGVISLNAARNAVKSAVVLKVEQGKLKYQTTTTTRTDWSMPSAPAFIMSPKMMVAPMKMMPDLI